MTKRTKSTEHVCDYRCCGDSGHHAWPSPTPKRTKAKRTLAELNRDAEARRQVGFASEEAQSGDHLDFGLLCYERGRASVEADPLVRLKEGVQKAAKKLAQFSFSDQPGFTPRMSAIIDLLAAVERLERKR